jgi:Tat protein translocase TatB subunit
MGFFGMGWQEILIIGIAAMVIFGPDRLPELASQAGKALRDLRRMTQDMQGEFERETGVSVRDLKKQVDKEIAGVKSELTGASTTIQNEVTSAKKTVQGASSAASRSTAKSTGSAAATTGSRSTVTAAKSGSSGNVAESSETAPVASKADPLAGVSLLDNVGETPVVRKPAASGVSAAASIRPAAPISSNGSPSSDREQAIQRARSRRLNAGYNQNR